MADRNVPDASPGAMKHDADVVAEAGSIDDFAWQGGIVYECRAV